LPHRKGSQEPGSQGATSCEDGSLPGIVEANDDGTYVLKLRGAGQWPNRGPNPDRFASQPFDAGRHVLLEVAAEPACAS